MSRLFGTDGVRGVAGVDLTADLARAVARAAVTELAPDGGVVVVGRDPRPSGGWLTDAVTEGLVGGGADVVRLGVIPTPAVARAVADGLPGLGSRPRFGVVVSASHNPVLDNGIKLFGPGGYKLSDERETAIEYRLSAPEPSAGSGEVSDHDWRDGYVAALLGTLPRPLTGLRIVVDAANGSAGAVAESVYAGAGADVTVINDDLSGEHINDGCGATHLDAIRRAVVTSDADAGIAHDGDADRCLAVTAEGSVVDGDAILAILALSMRARGQLRGHAIAATVMSNLGLARALRGRDIAVHTTDVGDRHVIERMRADGLTLGGEQSGHIVLLDHATTGDGLLTGLHLLAEVAASGRTLAELASVVVPLPQVLVNVRVADRSAAMAVLTPLADEIAADLGDEGRVLVRASGTEPLVRIMVEATSEVVAQDYADRLAAAVRQLRT